MRRRSCNTYRPGVGASTRCARTSSASSRLAVSGSVSARAAAAIAVMSGPGTSPSSRNSRRVSDDRVLYDRSNATRTAAWGSPSISSAGQPVTPQLCQVVGDRASAVDDVVGRRDPQGERPVPAQPGQLCHGFALTEHAVVTQQPSQQQLGFYRRQDVDMRRYRTVPRHQPGQLVPAGDQNETSGCARQQGSDLVGVGRVVQQHQHPLTGQDAAVRRGGLLQVDRDVLRRNPQRRQEPRHGVDRAQRRPERIAAQVDVQLTAREPVAHAVRPVHRQRRLAHPAGTRDGGDHHGRMSIPLVR